MTQSDFWSRRRAAVAAETQSETAQVEERQQKELESKTDREILAELNLPEPETLRPGDNVSGFMGKGVPERLRRRALRHLWKVNPELANLDGLVDYGEDFTDAATVMANLQTAYQVGKGMLEHLRTLAHTDQTDQDVVKPSGTGESGTEEDGMPNSDEMPDEPVLKEPVPSMDAATVENIPRTRRMRFTFESA